MIEAALVAEKVDMIRQQARALAGGAVSIIAVTKTFGCDAIIAASAAGCDGIGENYAQELLDKVEQGCIDLPVHFIGALQSNKIKSIADHVGLWQSIDRGSLVGELARRSPGARVLLQVNTTGEASKSGVSPGEFPALLDLALGAGLDVRGVMTLGPTIGSESAVRDAFGALRAIKDKFGLEICSMGMSQDYRVALECGSTMLRIGSALFGDRSKNP